MATKAKTTNEIVKQIVKEELDNFLSERSRHGAHYRLAKQRQMGNALRDRVRGGIEIDPNDPSGITPAAWRQPAEAAPGEVPQDPKIPDFGAPPPFPQDPKIPDFGAPPAFPQDPKIPDFGAPPKDPKIPDFGTPPPFPQDKKASGGHPLKKLDRKTLEHAKRIFAADMERYAKSVDTSIEEFARKQIRSRQDPAAVINAMDLIGKEVSKLLNGDFSSLKESKRKYFYVHPATYAIIKMLSGKSKMK